MILAAMTCVTVNIGAAESCVDGILHYRICTHMAGLTVVVMRYSDYVTNSMAVATVAHGIYPGMGGIREWVISAAEYRYIHVLTLVIDLVPVEVYIRAAVVAFLATAFGTVSLVVFSSSAILAVEDIKRTLARRTRCTVSWT